MLSDRFTLIELFDLSLRVPEVGAVNFNILHTALTHMATALGLEKQKPRCYIQNETAAQLAFTKARLSDTTVKDRESLRSAATAQDIEDRVKDLLKSQAKDQPESGQEEKSEEKDPSESKQEGQSGEKDQPQSGQEIKSDEVKVKQEEKSSSEDAEETTDDTKQPSTEKPEDVSEHKQTKKESQEPTMGVRDMLRAVNLNRRMEGVEKELRQLTTIADMLADKFKALETESSETTHLSKKLVDDLANSVERIQKLEEGVSTLTKRIEDSNEHGKNEIQRIEVAFKEDLRKIEEDLSTNVNDINEMMKETQDLITSKEDFAELVSRVDSLEEVKVNREELGRFMEEGFIENFIKEQESLRTDLDALELGITEVDNNVKAIEKRIDEEIIQYIDDSLEEVNVVIETMKEKLDRLDADDINDTFARLEDQAEKIAKDLETLETEESRLEKEARVNFKKISDLSDSLNKLKTSKVDKSKMYEVLELKADIETVTNKLDRSEFVSVMQDVEEKVESLTNKGEITEKNLDDGLASVRRALSFKMYTEDFVVATEPIRNRIKAMIYEQEKIKEMVLTRFLPDAPGVTKCFSCKRAANLTDGRKYQRIGPHPSESLDDTSKESQKKSERIKFPPIDLNSVPIPPADQPRIQDIHKLPVLFATARPQVGLAHHKRKKDIDRELSEYFGGEKDFKSIGGKHTKTFPQQRGLSFTNKTLTAEQRYEVLLEGLDKRIYKGSMPKNVQSDLPNDKEENSIDGSSNSSKDQSPNMVYPTPVVLHGKSGPVSSKRVVSLPVPK